MPGRQLYFHVLTDICSSQFIAYIRPSAYLDIPGESRAFARPITQPYLSRYKRPRVHRRRSTPRRGSLRKERPNQGWAQDYAYTTLPKTNDAYTKGLLVKLIVKSGFLLNINPVLGDHDEKAFCMSERMGRRRRRGRLHARRTGFRCRSRRRRRIRWLWRLWWPKCSRMHATKERYSDKIDKKTLSLFLTHFESAQSLGANGILTAIAAVRYPA